MERNMPLHFWASSAAYLPWRSFSGFTDFYLQSCSHHRIFSVVWAFSTAVFTFTKSSSVFSLVSNFVIPILLVSKTLVPFFNSFSCHVLNSPTAYWMYCTYPYKLSISTCCAANFSLWWYWPDRCDSSRTFSRIERCFASSPLIFCKTVPCIVSKAEIF